MEVEAVPQNNLKARLATTQSETAALQQINTALAALSTSAKSFASGSTWSQLSGTSSSSAVTVTASSDAVPASFSLAVKQTATAARTTITAAALAGSAGTAFSLTGKGTTTAIDSGGTLTGLAAAINATTKTTGVQAQLVHSTTGDVLLLNSADTGSAASFSLTNATDASTLASATGTDAKVLLNGTTEVASSSNTFTDLMPGIDVTLGADANNTTTSAISVAADGASRATAMKAFVGQLNDVLDQLSATTAYGTITAGQAAAGGGVLPGDSTLRSVADQLINTVFPGGTTSMASYGVSIDRDGRFTFDSAAFTKAYAADPDGVQQAFIGTGSFTERVQKVADAASDPYEGTVSLYIKSENTEADRYSDQIAAWDDRLATRQASLQQLYTNLETTLSRLQAQQSWLSSQLDSIDGTSTSKK